LQNIKLVGISQQIWRDYAIDQQEEGPLWVIRYSFTARTKSLNVRHGSKADAKLEQFASVAKVHLPIDGVALGVVQTAKLEPRIIRYHLGDHDWSVIKPTLRARL
jgi:hypothetical protein